ncbi:DNA-binding SARP family transcriptional activator [Kibdelosporangium banguiense]|uniref:DNA-binding SARP family transcriptional activator n=1 Tax=Kibdelosporangium banguiense TaxID=1365924 RepID=A0ABS4TCX9_9PSEU|nr:BTAD domain-containing putative transcriptional regulator [Kibdelosporangium banguiense]MBP2322204.1 DNA-binding SARP family transcriptional activator [Kibdelosporangium banguiense]
MTELGFGVLGAIEVTRAGSPVTINGPKLRVLLAALLLRANTTVSVDRIAHRLWGDLPPATAKKNIQVYALRLRRALGDETGSVIETQPDGYLIRLRPEQLDLLRFRSLTDAARDAGDLDAELDLLTEALSCWRGPALSDVPSESLRQDEVVQLEEARLRAEERRVDISLELGRHGEVLGELTRLTHDHPWQESFWAQLITAQHRSGRLGDALASYRKVHRILAEDLGISPGPRLQAAHRAVLDGPAVETVRPASPTVCQLPSDVDRFVGREDLIDRLTGPSRRRNVVISGPPGVGKTALAVHVAHLSRRRYPDGQLYMNLQGYGPDPPLTAEAALARFLGTLGVAQDQVPADPEDRAALFRSIFMGRKMLLLLDNAVHIDQVRPLLPTEPDCMVLVTSRGDLRGLSVEQVALGVLTGEESRAVLAGLLDDFRTQAEPDALAGLADACAHLPLALRIAGANLAANPHRGIAEYTDAMTSTGRLTELAIDDDEQSAVRVAFDQSYLRMPEACRSFFRLLGLTPGPDISSAAAAALAGVPHTEAIRTLNRLAEVSLIDPTTPGRHRLHDLIREYAADRAETEDGPENTTAALSRFASYYLHSAATAARLLYPSTSRRPLPEPAGPPPPLNTEQEALSWLDEERYNLVAAITWAATHPVLSHYAWQFVDVLRVYLQARGHHLEVVAACTAALESARRSADRAAEVALLNVLGLISHNVSEYDRSTAYHRQALTAAREINDLDAEADALRNLGRDRSQCGEPTAALQYYREALVVSRKAGNVEGEALAMNYIGTAHTSAGRARTAVHWHQRAVDLAKRSGSRETLFRSLSGRAVARWSLSRLDDAISDHQQVLEYCREVGQPFGELAALIGLAETTFELGRIDEAQSLAGEALRLGQELGDKRGEATARELVATIHRHRGEPDAAIEGYLEAFRLVTAIGFGYGEPSVLLGLAAAYRAIGEPRRALTYSEEALTRLRLAGQLLLEPQALTEIAEDHLALDDSAAASAFADEAVRLAGKRGQRAAAARAREVRLMCT